MENLRDTIYMVGEAIEKARKYGLVEEVIATALIRIKEDPSITPEEAMQYGLEEWDL